MNNIQKICFKSENISFNNPHKGKQMPIIKREPEEDIIVVSNPKLEQAKKEKKQQKIQIAAVTGIFTVAVALLAKLIFDIKQHRASNRENQILLQQLLRQQAEAAHSMEEAAKDAAEKSKNLFKVDFENLAENASIADIRTTKTLSDKVQSFFVNLLDIVNFDSKYLKRAGVESKGFPNASLLLGGPGVGKTETVRMYSKAAKADIATIKLGDFANSYVDGTATNMLNMFKAIKEKLEEAQQKEPDKVFVILFDEVDGLARKLDKIGSNNEYLGKNRQSFITGLDMILPFKNVRVFATSNVPFEEIDDAVVSRLKRNVVFETPNPTQTFEALKFHLKDCEGTQGEGFDFFVNKKDEIDKFLQELYEKNGVYRDLANIVQDAQAKYADAMEKAKDDTMLFDVKYLRKALEEKGILANEGKIYEA